VPAVLVSFILHPAFMTEKFIILSFSIDFLKTVEV